MAVDLWSFRQQQRAKVVILLLLCDDDDDDDEEEPKRRERVTQTRNWIRREEIVDELSREDEAKLKNQNGGRQIP